MDVSPSMLSAEDSLKQRREVCERVDLSGLCECGWSTDRLWLIDYYLRLDPCTELVLCLEHSSPVICVGVYGATCTLQWFISA